MRIEEGGCIEQRDVVVHLRHANGGRRQKIGGRAVDTSGAGLEVGLDGVVDVIDGSRKCQGNPELLGLCARLVSREYV